LRTSMQRKMLQRIQGLCAYFAAPPPVRLALPKKS
jgi:hypothetical protein